MKIILASNSPRRKELLERAGIDFIIDASSIEEVLDESLPIKERLENLAIQKGEPIHEKYPEDTVISADTTVYHHGHVIGKPKDKEEAIKILTELSGETHIAYTAVSIWMKDNHISFVEETSVTFKDITAYIPDYLETDKWQDRAGAYGIQDVKDLFVESIQGDINTVIGLPVDKIVKILKEFHII